MSNRWLLVCGKTRPKHRILTANHGWSPPHGVTSMPLRASALADQQRRDGAPPLAHQKVVRSTGRLGVHGLHANAPRVQAGD